MTRTKVALVGIGKIALDQHVPALNDSKDWELAATVSRSAPSVRSNRQMPQPSSAAVSRMTVSSFSPSSAPMAW